MGIGEADSNYGPTNYEGFIDADGFDGGDGQVGVVGDGKNHMEEFDMSAEDSRGLKGGRKLNQMGGRESKLNAKNAWGTTTGYAEELAKRGMVEIDEYGEDKHAGRGGLGHDRQREGQDPGQGGDPPAPAAPHLR